MIGQHAIFSGLPKSLAYIASIYCNYYYYWKDEGKDWDPKVGEDQLWYYNCEDLVYTDEAAAVIESVTKKLGLESVQAFQQSMLWPVLQAMQRGVRIDPSVRSELILEVQDEIARREAFLEQVLGHSLNVRSNGESGQMQRLFYTDLKQPVIWKRGKPGEPSRPTLDDEALQTIAKREPILRPIVNAIADIRTLGIFLSSFLLKPLDTDGRMRCSFNIGGSESGKSAPTTYRLSSSENAFGSGGNLQNIPSEKSKSVGKAKARGGIPALGDPYQFPNIRRMFVPDPGYDFWDGDLDRADLQVVCWEAQDEMLKAALRLGVDMHTMNAFVLQGKDPPPLEELVEGHSRYWDHRGPRKHMREFAKVFVHGTNYGGGAATMAKHTGWTIHEIDRAQKIWFGAHPGIQRWHIRTANQVRKHRFVENRFGYRWYIFDRLDAILPEALAWVPQSTVSVVINKIWKNIYDNLPEVQVLLQVHDSLVGQFPSQRHDLKAKIKEQAKIVIPYDDPLVIPFGLKTSSISWGDCQ
jgi:DNA polymerase-1